MNSGELGLENFFKKVLLDFLLLLLFFICQTKGMINIVTFCFSLLHFLIFCSTYNCLLSAVWALIKFMVYKYEVYNVMPYPYFVYLAGSRY